MDLSSSAYSKKSSAYLSLSEIKGRIKSSFITLTARQIALRAIGFLTINIILARVLPVDTLGVFNIATAVISFFAFFSDVGLGASLIQKKDEITHQDIKTTFTIQQTLVSALSVIIVVLAPLLSSFYGLDENGVWLVRVLGICFFLTSLKVIPSVMLERNLNFKPLVGVEILETFVFNGLLIALVFLNFDLWSFTIASFSRSFLGVLAIYIVAPVKIGIGVDKISAKRLLSFGVPFQLNTLLALAKDRLVPLVVAKIIGTSGVGYVTWSQSLALLPLEIMNVVIRITFPAFSRLQEDKENLSKLVEKSLFITSLLVYPVLFGIGAILPSLVEFVVSDKWKPAVFSFYLFAFSTYWAVISTTFTNTLNAIGQIKITLKLMVMWTVLTFILTPILSLVIGFQGVAVSSFVISFSSVLTIIYVKKVLAIKVLEAVALPTISSLLMAILVYTFSIFFVREVFSLILAIFIGVSCYFTLIFIFGKDKIKNDIKSLRNV